MVAPPKVTLGELVVTRLVNVCCIVLSTLNVMFHSLPYSNMLFRSFCSEVCTVSMLSGLCVANKRVSSAKNSMCALSFVIVHQDISMQVGGLKLNPGGILRL